MQNVLRILFLEDAPADAELAIAVLEEAGYSCEWDRVDERMAFLDRLTVSAYDLIISDYSMPHFNGLSAIRLFVELGMDIPFILVSGTLGDETATETLKAGATDFVLKDKLFRLPMVVQRALREKAEQRRIKDAERQIHLQAAALKSAANAIVITDPNGIITFVNPAFTALTGYSPKEALGQGVHILKSGEHSKEFYSDLWATVLAGHVWRGEIVNRRKDGATYTEEQTITPVMDGNGTLINFVAIKHDITSRKHLEERLRQAQKMEAIAGLAGGVAHDFNNLLTAISGYSELALNKIDVTDAVHRYVSEIKAAGDKAAGLTAQLLAFSRRQVLKPSIHNPNYVIERAEKMLTSSVGENIEFRIALEPKLKNIKADQGQIEQVIMNMVINAGEAMPDGGQITIETHNVHLDKDYVADHLEVTPGPFVKIVVTDTGKGIDAQVLQHLFEPFYTTKGHGTGLGLSTVYGIVKQSGGDVTVSSEIGHGTTFTVYLPCFGYEAEAGPSPDKPKTVDRVETILIVEDDRAIRNLIHGILTGDGYRVLEADSGGAAVAICSIFPSTIHLVLTDVVMPEMDSTQLKTEIKKLRPDVKLIFMSGHTLDTVSQTGVLDDGAAFLEKPFTPEILMKKVRDVLDG